MRSRIVTLMWGDAFQRYGRKFLETFERYWPEDVELCVVTDRKRHMQRGSQVLLDEVPGCREFLMKWGSDRKAQGFDSGYRKLDGDGRSWRHDAVKWMPQGIAPRAALDGLKDGDILAWFDADVETLKPVPKGWLEQLLDGHDVACIQRPGVHSEIGFWAMRLGSATRNVIREFAYCYATGAVFGFSEYHSAYVFDRALASEKGLKVRNLNGNGPRNDPWQGTPLAQYTVHRKGKRKDA